ncbi:hypothetical protein CCACVL1_00916, partial [Corchorus capsularis]
RASEISPASTPFTLTVQANESSASTRLSSAARYRASVPVAMKASIEANIAVGTMSAEWRSMKMDVSKTDASHTTAATALFSLWKRITSSRACWNFIGYLLRSGGTVAEMRSCCSGARLSHSSRMDRALHGPGSMMWISLTWPAWMRALAASITACIEAGEAAANSVKPSPAACATSAALLPFRNSAKAGASSASSSAARGQQQNGSSSQREGKRVLLERVQQDGLHEIRRPEAAVATDQRCVWPRQGHAGEREDAQREHEGSGSKQVSHELHISALS